MPPVTLAEIDMCLDIAAELCSDKDGDIYIPLYERLEREREIFLARDDTRSRIAARLSAKSAVHQSK